MAVALPLPGAGQDLCGASSLRVVLGPCDEKDGLRSCPLGALVSHAGRDGGHTRVTHSEAPLMRKGTPVTLSTRSVCLCTSLVWSPRAEVPGTSSRAWRPHSGWQSTTESLQVSFQKEPGATITGWSLLPPPTYALTAAPLPKTRRGSPMVTEGQRAPKPDERAWKGSREQWLPPFTFLPQSCASAWWRGLSQERPCSIGSVLE